MKYWNRPSWLCSSPKLMKCLSNDNIPFGRNVFNTIADLIAQRFDYGDWWASGKKEMPYGMDIMKGQFYYELGIKDSQIEEVIEILDRLSEHDIIHFEDRGESIWIEYPDMMSFVDKTNKDNARKLFGKGKTTEDIKDIMGRHVYDAYVNEDNKSVNEKKLINRIDKKKSNKLNSSYTNKNECKVDNFKYEIVNSNDDDKSNINHSQLTDENISYASDIDICKLYKYHFSELSKSQQILVEERYQEITNKEQSV